LLCFGDIADSHVIVVRRDAHVSLPTNTLSDRVQLSSYESSYRLELLIY